MKYDVASLKSEKPLLNLKVEEGGWCARGALYSFRGERERRERVKKVVEKSSHQISFLFGDSLLPYSWPLFHLFLSLLLPHRSIHSSMASLLHSGWQVFSSSFSDFPHKFLRLSSPHFAGIILFVFVSSDPPLRFVSVSSIIDCIAYSDLNVVLVSYYV